MTRRINLISGFVMIPFVVGAGWLNVTEPMVGRPYGQPALVSDQAASRLAPSGFDQAQGRGQ